LGEEKRFEFVEEESDIATNYHNDNIQGSNNLIENALTSRRSSFKRNREVVDELKEKEMNNIHDKLDFKEQ
jgi:hypothetical protein